MLSTFKRKENASLFKSYFKAAKTAKLVIISVAVLCFKQYESVLGILYKGPNIAVYPHPSKS